MLTEPHALGSDHDAPLGGASGPSAPARKRSGGPQAVVIGAGFGGLAAAIRLAVRGYRVTVLDRLHEPGGRAAPLRQNGYEFDAGPTIVTAPFLLEELWALCGRRLSDDIELASIDPFYRIRFFDGETFEASGDEDRVRAEVAKLSPGDLPGYDRFLQDSRARFAYGFMELAPRPFTRFMDLAKTLPKMAMLRADRSIYGHVARRFRDPRLRIAFSFHPLFVGGNPFDVTSMYGLIAHLERTMGVHYPMGGMGALAAAMARLAEAQGVEIRYGETVAAITVENGRATGVETEAGARLAADVVVSNADAAWTYTKLVAPRHRRVWTDAKMARKRHSMGLFVWYFGLRGRADHLPHHTLVLGPRYRELLSDIFHKKRLADDMSLYLSRPTATDPSLAPDGCDSFYALSPVPHLGADVDWSVEAERYRAKVQARLEETVLPGLGDRLEASLIRTPLSFRDDLLSYLGSGFALEPTLLQSAWFRPHNRSEDVDRLYLVGAGTHPGPGIPGVLSSARVLDHVVPDPAALV